MKKSAKRLAKFAAAMLSAAVICTSACGCSQSKVEDVINEALSDSNTINIVKNGSFVAYPDQTIGTAFNNFFSNPSWQEFKSDDGQRVVEFNGNFYYLDSETGEFQLYGTSFNHVPQNNLTQNALLVKVFESE